MKLIEELKGDIVKEESYLDTSPHLLQTFDWKYQPDYGIGVSVNEAKKIVRMYEILEDLMNTDELSAVEFKVLQYEKEFEKLKLELIGL